MNELISDKNVAINLLEHRERLLKAGDRAYLYDINRCYKTVIRHLQKSGYKKISSKKCPQLIKTFVDLIFEAQYKKPFFHIEGDLPFCWNSPANGGWELDYIKYEWGHFNSINQNINTAHNIENLCLQSARCNQHIQSSLNIPELLSYGGKLEEVVTQNIKRRNELFKSKEWKLLIENLEHYKDQP